MTQFFSAGDDLKVSEEQRQEAVALCQQSDQEAALGCMAAFGTTDFRDDLTKVSVPTLVIHGDATASCRSRAPASSPTRRSRAASSSCSRAHRTAATSATPSEFNAALLEFLEK